MHLVVLLALPLPWTTEQCAEKCAIGEKNGPLPLWSSGPLELFCFHLRKGASYREATVLNESENQWGDEGSRYHRGERESRRKLKEEPQEKGG